MTQRRDHQPALTTGPYPEFTIWSVALGYLFGVLITITVSYASLVLGFSATGSDLAAIMGFGVLRGIMRRKSIVENNVCQTLASAVNVASAGMVFTLPALFILGHTDFSPYLIVLGCMAGGVLGVAFIIPLRKQMIDLSRLTFPASIALAAILKSPGAGVRKAKLMLGAGLVGALVHLFVYQLGGWHNLDIGNWVGMPDYMNGLWYLSLLAVAVGYLAGRGGAFFAIAGFTGYWFLAPVLATLGALPTPADGQGIATALRVVLFRPVGIGMLMGGAITGVIIISPLLVSAIRSMHRAANSKATHSRDEMPIRLLFVAIAGAFVVLFVVATLSATEIGLVRSLVMAVLGTLWIWLAGVIVSECGGRTGWPPLSGLTLVGVTLLLVVVSGVNHRDAIIASVTVGAAMCVAMSQAADLMVDLKTGHLIGAIPRRQQIAQFAGTWLGPIIVIVMLFVLHEAKGLGSEELPAPQGHALASMINSVLGGDVPYQKYIAGAALGGLLSASGAAGLGVLVGLAFYMPFNIVLTFSIGTVLRIVSDKKLGRGFAADTGFPLAVGFAIGEAIVGVCFAFKQVFFG